jgi:hypothetical protein
MTPKSIALLSAACLFLASCGKGGGSGASGGGDESTASAPQSDFSKPYLSEAKVQGVVKVMQEDPEFWKEYAKGWNPLTVKGKMAELDAHARKQGFSDFQDYTNSAMRVWAGMGLIAMEKTQAEMVKSFEKVPEDATPEMKKMMEDQKKAMLEGMAGMSDQQKLNDADRKLIEKHWSQLEAAGK